jgi:hypothetical protein
MRAMSEEQAMTIRQLLLSFASVKSGHRILVDDEPLPAAFRSPGMHQVIEEADQFVLTHEDRDFLRQLGIRTSCFK